MKTTLDPTYIIDGLRTAIGVPFKSLKNFTVAQMSACVFEELIQRNKIKKNLISEVMMGISVPAGTGQNFARKALELSGLPLTIPAYTVGYVCGSGLQAVIFAIQSLLTRNSKIVIAGGAESTSQSPYLIPREEEGPSKTKKSVDSMKFDGLWCSMTGKSMGDLCEDLAQQYRITRQQQDVYSYESHCKAYLAKINGKFKNEIVPIPITKNRIFAFDDRTKRNTSLQALTQLSTAFRRDGTITAGSSSAPCDGACALVLAGKETVEKELLVPRARILGYTSIALSPERTFEAAIPAVEMCLDKCELSLSDIDLFEISESFAAQAILTKNRLKIPDEKLNIFGGDIALGHPLGAAGVRVLVTLLHALINQKKKKGLASVCLGGGGAIAIAIEVV